MFHLLHYQNANMNKSEKIPCRICNSSMSIWPAKWLGFEWGRCSECRSVQKIIDHSRYLALGATYDPGYIETEQVVPGELEKRMDVDGKEELLQRLLGPTARGSMLDIGCGMGGYLLAAKRLGLKAVGVEPSAAHSKAAVDVFGLDVIEGFFKSDNFDQKFDVVILSHVIEHIYKPVEFIQDVMKVIRADGRLIIITPNCDSISARLCMKFWSMYKPIDHVTLFSKKSLMHVVPHGSSLETLKTSEWPGEFAAHILSSLKTLLRPVITGVGAGRPEGTTRKSTLSFATRLTLAFLSLPAYWVGYLFDRRSCLYAVIRKNNEPC